MHLLPLTAAAFACALQASNKKNRNLKQVLKELAALKEAKQQADSQRAGLQVGARRCLVALHLMRLAAGTLCRCGNGRCTWWPGCGSMALAAQLPQSAGRCTSRLLRQASDLP